MTSSQLTIVVVYRNRDLQRVKRHLHSLANQTRRDFTVHFVDYGSRSSLARSVQSLVEQFSFCRYIYTDTRGWSFRKPNALNIGIRLAETDTVLNTDIDIIFAPNFIETLMQAQDGNSAVYCAPVWLPKSFTDWNNVTAYATAYPTKPRYIGTCQCYPLQVMQDIQGVDEQYEYYGEEDFDIQLRLKEWGLCERWINDQTAIFHQWHEPRKQSTTYRKQFSLPYTDENCTRLIRNQNGWGNVTRRNDRLLFDGLPVAETEEPVGWLAFLNELKQTVHDENLGPLWFITDHPAGLACQVATESGYHVGLLKISWLNYLVKSPDRASGNQIEQSLKTTVHGLGRSSTAPPGAIVLDVSTYLSISKNSLEDLLAVLNPGGFVVIPNLQEPRLPTLPRHLGKVLEPILEKIHRTASTASPRTLEMLEWVTPETDSASADTHHVPVPKGRPFHGFFKNALKYPYLIARTFRAKIRKVSSQLLSFFKDNYLRDTLYLARVRLPDVSDYSLDFPLAGATAIFLKDNNSKATSPVKPTIAYFEFQFGREAMYRGGSGIELVGLKNYLQAQQHQASIRFVPCPPNSLAGQSHWQKLRCFISHQWQEIRTLLTTPEEVLLFFYPKIPFLGHSDDVKILLFAGIGYSLLALKKKFTRQRVAVLILDLPLEQQLITEQACSRTDLDDVLVRFRIGQRLIGRHQLFTLIERILFGQADTVVSLSRTMTDHLVRKHGLIHSKICPRGRNFFLPTYRTPPPPMRLADGDGLRIFYSGDLVRPTTVSNLKRILRVFQDFPSSHLYICGRDGDWLRAEGQSLRINNVHYLGALDFATHDAVAKQCDLGLLLYSFAYANLVPTSKYSAYVGNGLAILSTDMVTLAENTQEDQVGMAVPIADLPDQLAQWLHCPEQVRPYKEQARRLSQNFKQGSYMQEWFEQLL